MLTELNINSNRKLKELYCRNNKLKALRSPSLSATPLITATNAAEAGKTVTVTATGSWTTATTES